MERGRGRQKVRIIIPSPDLNTFKNLYTLIEDKIIISVALNEIAESEWKIVVFRCCCCCAFRLWAECLWRKLDHVYRSWVESFVLLFSGNALMNCFHAARNWSKLTSYATSTFCVGDSCSFPSYTYILWASRACEWKRTTGCVCVPSPGTHEYSTFSSFIGIFMRISLFLSHNNKWSFDPMLFLAISSVTCMPLLLPLSVLFVYVLRTYSLAECFFSPHSTGWCFEKHKSVVVKFTSFSLAVLFAG